MCGWLLAGHMPTRRYCALLEMPRVLSGVTACHPLMARNLQVETVLFKTADLA